MTAPIRVAASAPLGCLSYIGAVFRLRIGSTPRAWRSPTMAPSVGAAAVVARLAPWCRDAPGQATSRFGTADLVARRSRKVFRALVSRTCLEKAQRKDSGKDLFSGTA